MFETSQLFYVLMCLKLDEGYIVQSIALIVSNAAALLPAYWALRQRVIFLVYTFIFNALFVPLSHLKADVLCSKQDYAEWVLFTSSGISSALYHACDVGTWCVLTYNVLQVRVIVIFIIVIFCVKLYLVTKW